MSEHDGSHTVDDRLLSLCEAVALVPFSETTLRRAIGRGELEAWQPNSGKLVMWRSALFEWATRRPASGGRSEPPPGDRAAGATCRRHPTRSRFPISLDQDGLSYLPSIEQRWRALPRPTRQSTVAAGVSVTATSAA